jgi:GNAT superfamily N-acetyltransferase
VSSRTDIVIIDVTDATSFDRLPPCADSRFDHRSCDYWEDEVRGRKAARPSWWQPASPSRVPRPRPVPENPFAAAPSQADAFNPFVSASDSDSIRHSDDDDAFATPDFNPFAPAPEIDSSAIRQNAPSKLRLLDRGRAVFGSYAKILLLDDEPAVYAQFGPLSAYPRAQQIRELYPRLPRSPLPAVITCLATTKLARGQGLGRALIADIAADLAQRGFAAVEAYPDLTLETEEASSASPAFWERCGFHLAADDERYPVMRLELD